MPMNHREEAVWIHQRTLGFRVWGSGCVTVHARCVRPFFRVKGRAHYRALA